MKKENKNYNIIYIYIYIYINFETADSVSFHNINSVFPIFFLKERELQKQ